jgi:hypothetical protein
MLAAVSTNSTFLQDLEEIEEWNEFGELRMIVNSVQDLDGMPATSNSLPVVESPAPAPSTPKPSTIKIQSPPAIKPEDKKDESAVLALRQASSEAANKAKSKADEKKDVTKKDAETKAEEQAPTPDPPSSTSPTIKAHRGSVAPELPDITPDSSNAPKRPPLIPEVAAVSSANFRVENAEELGLVEHHRGSIISGGDNADRDSVVTEIRQSISGAEGPGGSLDALRKEAAERPRDESIVEEVAGVEESEDVRDEVKKDAEEEKKDVPSESKEKSTTTAQDTKVAVETSASKE